MLVGNVLFSWYPPAQAGFALFSELLGKSEAFSFWNRNRRGLRVNKEYRRRGKLAKKASNSLPLLVALRPRFSIIP
jgi:hypothetical protein